MHVYAKQHQSDADIKVACKDCKRERNIDVSEHEFVDLLPGKVVSINPYQWQCLDCWNKAQTWKVVSK